MFVKNHIICRQKGDLLSLICNILLAESTGKRDFGRIKTPADVNKCIQLYQVWSLEVVNKWFSAFAETGVKSEIPR